MNSVVRSALVGLGLAVSLGASAAAAPEQFVPEVQGGKMQRDTAATIADAIEALRNSGRRPSWVGWAVSKVAGGHQMCCFTGGHGSLQVQGSGSLDLDTDFGEDRPCRLKKHSNWVRIVREETGVPGDRFLVLVRVEGGEIDQVRTASSICTLRTGGLDLHWLPDVSASESVAWLAALIDHGPNLERVAGPAMTAVALHEDAAAGPVIERLATGATGNASLRSDAIFWLGWRGRPGLEALRRLAREEPDVEIRKEIPMGLAQSSAGEASAELIRMARKDPSPEVRGHALFWMAQQAGDKVVGILTDAIDDDPETEVKKAALSALVNLPDGEGVPLLIKLARTHKNPEIRREAMFWLGTTEDPRALDFIESVLNR